MLAEGGAGGRCAVKGKALRARAFSATLDCAHAPAELDDLRERPAGRPPVTFKKNKRDCAKRVPLQREIYKNKKLKALLLPAVLSGAFNCCRGIQATTFSIFSAPDISCGQDVEDRCSQVIQACEFPLLL